MSSYRWMSKSLLSRILDANTKTHWKKKYFEVVWSQGRKKNEDWTSKICIQMKSESGWVEGKCQEDGGHLQREAGEKFKEQKILHKLTCGGNESRGSSQEV